MSCSCPHLMLGSERLEQKNWNPDCEEHGLDSEWWNSDEEVERRRTDLIRRRELFRRARDSREMSG